MSIEQGLAGGRPVLAPMTARDRGRDHRFFTGMAAAAALTVFVGFAPTYYLRGLAGSPPLPGLVHLHGVVFTAWMLLFLAQTSLVSAGRTDLHRRLGIGGAVLAALIIVLGYATAIEAARRGVRPPGGPPPLVFLSVPLGALVAFTVLAGTGLSFRGRSETHKRLMLLATLALVAPALARMRFIGEGGPPAAIGGTGLFVAACLIYDRAAHSRVHPAFLWGGLFLLLSLPVRAAVGHTDAWLAVAGWLTR
ncbi:MAG TPA: hypothetical protein VMN37_01275 [Gemmatimonadales bacterium]|nr:hypothetical protein [Gemmatimonadales bacterium]